jgi:hypothetical protein
MSDPRSPHEGTAGSPAIPLEVLAGIGAVVLVVLAAGIGIGLGRRAVPPPAPAPTPIATAQLATPRPAPTPLSPAALEERAFAQPLVAGCATTRAVWLFADGGSAVRFDGEAWTIPDPTLRSHLAAACLGPTAVAVGRGGSVLTIDDELRQARVDQLASDDLTAIALFPEGAFAAGERATVLRQDALGWSAMATGATEDLHGVFIAVQGLVRPGRAQAWIVGAGGASHRLIETGWERVPTGTTATLRAVLQEGDAALAVGDGGTILRSAGARWSAVPSGTDMTLRAVAIVGPTTAWIVGDRGTVLELSGDQVRRIDLGTACTLRAVFLQDAAIWIVGSDGTRGAAWRIEPTGTKSWGSCGT